MIDILFFFFAILKRKKKKKSRNMLILYETPMSSKCMKSSVLEILNYILQFLMKQFKTNIC